MSDDLSSSDQGESYSLEQVNNEKGRDQNGEVNVQHKQEKSSLYEIGTDHVHEETVEIQHQFKMNETSMCTKILEHLKPFRRGNSSSQEFPGNNVGWISYCTFSFMTSYMWQCYRKKALELSDLWNCSPETSCEVNSKKLEHLWAAEVKQKGIEHASLGWVIVRFARTRILFHLVLQMVMMALAFIGPTFLLHALLEYTQSPDTDLAYGLLLALALFCVDSLRCVLVVSQLMLTVNTGIQVKSAVSAMLYHKILNLRSLQDKSMGELVNLFANDAMRIFQAVTLGPMVLGGPIIGVAATGYALYVLGPWALLSIAVFLLYYPYQALISRATIFFRRKAITITDKRVRLMSEILTCIKLIKLYAWEKAFSKTVAAIRRNECRMLEGLAFVHTLSVSITPLMPVLAAVVTFSVHTMMGNNLTASQAFVIVGILWMLRYRMLGPVANTVKSISESMYSQVRIKQLLVMEETAALSPAVSSPNLALEVSDGNFAWDIQRLESVDGVKANDKHLNHLEHNGNTELERLCSEKTKELQHTHVLFDINFKIPKGQLYGVCGSVGSGKSSLISAILGLMVKLTGRVAVSGSIAYVSQQAWVMNASLRDNILFGLPFEEKRYDQVLKHCCLEADVEMLPAGDMTEIGERGINLSGGQKQRVSLARAVYAKRDIYLLDDPLSAVDVHVGRHIFDNIFKRMLEGKTIFFITHQLQYLAECDRIAFIKDGQILEEGCHEELMTLNGEYASLINNYHSFVETHEQHDSCQTSCGTHKKLSPKFPLSPECNYVGSAVSLASVVSGDSVDGEVLTDGHLVDDEEIEKGSVSAASYLVYMRSAGGFVISALVMLVFSVPVAISAFSNWWLSYWIQQGSGNTTFAKGNKTVAGENITDNPNLHFYVTVYCMTAVAVVLSLCIRGALFMKVSFKASCTLHEKVFAKVLRSPMSFFDTTPVGRIINRFSRDLDDVDVTLPLRVEHVLQNGMLVLAVLTMISLVFPWFLVTVVPLIALFWFVNTIFRVVLREVKRLDGTTRSPIFSWLTASIQGLHTIHAYGKKEEFLRRFYEVYNQNNVVYLFYQLSVRWMTLRLDMIATVVNTITAIFVVITKGNIPTALAGLALAYAAQLTSMIQLTVRMMAEAESSFVAVERIYHYIRHVEAEAPPVVDDCRPSTTWPQEGAISYEKYKVRYREGLPLVLKGISCHIKAKEKIGIVGRTGSGKSSLGLSIFRLMEPAGGCIYIDGIDITTIGLDDLRSKLSIIPQDPVLFIGTIRYNLDPFNHHTDEELWNALEKCHLKEMVSQLEGQLEATVLENGENFSVGERQLVCMARALLRHSKILILDEATAAIDTETDALIQATIREAFADCTLLTIAHRLNTIMDSDRVMILTGGKIIEFDDPQVLLSNPHSHFSAMVKMDR